MTVRISFELGRSRQPVTLDGVPIVRSRFAEMGPGCPSGGTGRARVEDSYPWLLGGAWGMSVFG